MNKQIKLAADALASGKLVAFPTETVYGLGADATNAVAVQSIYKVKGRPSYNPLIVHVSDTEMAAKYVQLSALAKMLMAQFWPGALTLVMKRREDCPLAKEVSAGGDTVAIRCPAHSLAHSLIEALGQGIAAPSANRSGRVSPTSAAHVKQELGDSLGNELAMVLDDGECTLGIESTVVDVTGERAKVLRPGNVTYGMLSELLGEQLAPLEHIEENAKPHSPGLLTSHYAPNVKVRMNVAPTDVEEGTAYLGFGDMACDANLSSVADVEEAARNLFAMLRLLDAPERYAAISVAPIPNDGVGSAINDRLLRASA